MVVQEDFVYFCQNLKPMQHILIIIYIMPNNPKLSGSPWNVDKMQSTNCAYRIF